MRLLLDTHLLLWAAGEPDRLSPTARAFLDDPENGLLFSAASIWEIVIKSRLGRADFRANASLIRRGLLDNAWEELAITSAHAIAVANLPPLHKDPFDRMLLAQAGSEGVLLLTSDAGIAQYPGPVRLV